MNKPVMANSTSIKANSNDASTQQRAIIVEEPGPEAHVLIKDIEIPHYQPDEVLIRLSHSGVCHADVAFIFGDWKKLSFGVEGSKTPGHEGVGEVVAIGSDVKNLAVGDRVGTKWLRSVCWKCDYCIEGKENLCHLQVHYGRSSPGSFQQYVTSPANYTPKIPAEISDEKAGPLLCAGVTMYRALKISGATAGQWVVIAGSGGGLGHLGIQFAKKMGFNVIGIDSGDKEALCTSLGVHHFIDFKSTPDIPSEVRKITGEGAHAFLVASGTRSSYEQARGILRSGGVLLCIGLPTESFDIPFQPLDMLSNGYWVTGVNASGLKDVQAALDFAASHEVNPVVEVFPMAKAEHVFGLLHRGQITGRLVLDLR